ncbi:hypothetical protein BABA_18422 [Neobacillus bataviensis LMG 21833]|uniref:DUF2515 domain-containing protein n=1 Tax=Neobacillus bataviensis LMG 21833 TaxID=1117379 RepID=K6C3P4_9BACI|nr:DUF2515 family protein [Neobacillus bataviensis]EKN65765.1 hypothetical protein BABA_18422 [Neobacillus bataviensis LMG 21833]
MPFLLDSFSDVKKELKKKMKKKSSGLLPCLSENDKQCIHHIREQTRQLNQNNIARTQAYFQFYLKHPEIHWALLGHMVSRNVGWNMTDLKGELLTKLLPERDQIAFFSFLERGSWLIFQDVYPQFLVYDLSVRCSQEMFHLLPHLSTSTFMETLWRYFWHSGDSYTLAIATVINEQSYLEKRLIQNNHFKNTVTGTVSLKMYDFLRLNNILFPYCEEEKREKTSLVGATSRHFTSLHERILFGKKLYSLLFQREKILAGVMKWAHERPHTGSRKDYWPDLFNDVNESFPRSLYKRRVKNCVLRKGAERLYSPPLKYAWPNTPHEDAESGDWFEDWHVLDYIHKEVSLNGEILNNYCKTLETIELAVMAKEALLLREEE